ncbi:MAG: DMT family transporter [Clostridia bacterium]|nr:DMT family transporter [Clostridia bacterium]
MKKQSIYYVYLALVIVIWGVIPLINSVYFYNYYSATAFTAICSLMIAISFTLISWKSFKLLNKKYFTVAVITGLCYSLAELSQRIGLQYTTPSMYAFLENTSCIVVPILMLILFRKKPNGLTAISCLVCLAGCFVLNGGGAGGKFGVGEILCGLAGVLYAGNIVGTGTYGKDLHAPLFLMIQRWIHTVMSFSVMLVLHFTKVDSVPLEAIKVTFDAPVLFLLILNALGSGTLCWLLRTVATTKLDVTFISVAMPLSAVITLVLSVICGTDALTSSLIIGAFLIFVAVVLSGLGGVSEQKKAEKQMATAAIKQ